MARYRRALFAAVLLLSLALCSALLVPERGAAMEVPPQPLFLDLGPGASLNILEDGLFGIFSGRELLGTSSHWTVRAGEHYLAPGSEAFAAALASPVHAGDGSLRLLLCSEGVITELDFQSCGDAALLTATVVNPTSAAVQVALRLALDIHLAELSLDGSGAITRETSIAPGAYSQLVGSKDGATAFSCMMPDAPWALQLTGAPEYAVGSQWEFPVNPNLVLGEETAALLFWPERALGPGDVYQVRVLLAAGPAGPVAFPQKEAAVTSVEVSPFSEVEQRPRTVRTGVKGIGPAAVRELALLFLLEGAPSSIQWVNVESGRNDSVRLELPWIPAVRGNYTVCALLSFFDDRTPGDNVKAQNAVVLANPFRFVMRFHGDMVAFSNHTYAGARIVVQMYIYNTGFDTDTYRIMLAGVPEGWTALLSGNQVTLGVNQMGRFNLSVRTAEDAGEGMYVFNVLGTSENGGGTQTLLVFLDVGTPPPSGTGGYQNRFPGISGQGNVSPPVKLRPYHPDTGGEGWGTSGGQLGMYILSAVGIAAALGILGVAIYQFMGHRTLSVMQRIIKRALYGLATGDEYRTTVFDAYRRMCVHLERHGYTREDHVTPREFEKAMRLALPLDTRYIRSLTRLFEEARYSDHRLGEQARRSAILNLQAIDSELDKLIIFHEVPTFGQWFRQRLGRRET